MNDEIDIAALKELALAEMLEEDRQNAISLLKEAYRKLEKLTRAVAEAEKDIAALENSIAAGNFYGER